MAESFTKDPDAVLDYAWDWAGLTNGTTGARSDWLASGETIVSYTVTVPAGITKDSESSTTSTVTVWLSGGTVGTYYTIACEIVTSEGRTDERSIILLVANR